MGLLCRETLPRRQRERKDAMRKLYLVTGAAGHLGNTVVRMLAKKGEDVRALVLPGEENAAALSGFSAVYQGDVRDKASMEAFFAADADTQLFVIHCAGIVTIASKFEQNVYDVNVTGTKHILELCKEHPVRKLVYVSSVHAIPELPRGQVIVETDHFDPDKVEGLYAKTKAEATALVLEAAKNGLPASVVHPSGICGPYDYGRGHLTQLFVDYYKGQLTAGLDGGYDFVDVRDVAAGVLACCDKGRCGEGYILSNRRFSIPELLGIFHTVSGRRRVRTILPMWFVRLTAPVAELYYKILRQPPLYTAYSVYTLTSNASFSHEKAARELGYTTRPFEDTVRDTMEWLQEQNRI